MAMNYEELDEKTRLVMLQEFEAEQAGGNPYVSKGGALSVPFGPFCHHVIRRVK